MSNLHLKHPDQPSTPARPGMSDSLIKWFPFFLVTGILLNALGLFTDITEPDSALYASIAKHIAITNDWVNLFGNGHDWLDKPHLPFWLCAFSFKCFGITAFAYKLPALVCWLIGVLYTYKLAKAIYGNEVAKLSVITYITAMHVVFSNSDTRAEAFLTAFIVAATYHIYRAMNLKWSWHIVVGAVYCAMAVMTKGIFILVTITSGFIIYWIYTRQFKQFIHLKWFALIILTGGFIIPELYCLYLQFDLHPEKIVFGHTQVSGIKFFFWDSQFGRFFNNGPIKGSGDNFFFIHTFLWAFIPWSLLTVIAVFALAIKKRKQVNKESIIITGSLLVTFIMFSISKFQLPHYLVIVFPHFVMMTSQYLEGIKSPRIMGRLNILQMVLFFAGIALVLYTTYATGLFTWYIPVFLLITITTLCLLLFRGHDLGALIGKGTCLAGLLYLFYFLSFYPSLMKYNAGMVAGRWFNQNMPDKNVYMYKCDSEAFDFYTKAPVGRLSDLDNFPKDPEMKDYVILFAPLEKLNMADSRLKIVQQFDYFHVTKLNLNFLSKEKRQAETGKFVLAEYLIK